MCLWLSKHRVSLLINKPKSNTRKCARYLRLHSALIKSAMIGEQDGTGRHVRATFPPHCVLMPNLSPKHAPPIKPAEIQLAIVAGEIVS